MQGFRMSSITLNLIPDPYCLKIMLADFCAKHLDLENAKLGDEYFYTNLPLCVIDAVFSIGIRYTITQNVVKKFCNQLEIEPFRKRGSEYPAIEEQLSINSLLDLYEKFSIDEITDKFYSSRNRTSSRNGILKSEAVFKFAKVLKDNGINYFQDLPSRIGDSRLENAIKEIPGQKSGISTVYFYMLAGEENLIKPDRMVIRFIESYIGRKVDAKEAASLILSTCEILVNKFPNLTPRLLDHEIWKFQKTN